MATFKITANSTVKSFSKAFKDEFGATLQIYDGRLKADDSVKLVDIGAKTGTFECRANRTVGSFVKMMNEDFNLKVKVRTTDDWVTVIDGLTLNRINDLPKQPTQAQMEDFVSYQRKETVSKEENQEKDNMDIYNLIDKIVEYSDDNPGDFQCTVEEDEIELFVRGYVYVNNKGGEGEITDLIVKKGHLSEEDIETIKEEFENTVSWS